MSPALAGGFFTVSATRETQASHFFGNLLDPTSPTEQVFLYQVAFPSQNPVSVYRLFIFKKYSHLAFAQSYIQPRFFFAPPLYTIREAGETGDEAEQ